METGSIWKRRSKNFLSHCKDLRKQLRWAEAVVPGQEQGSGTEGSLETEPDSEHQVRAAFAAVGEGSAGAGTARRPSGGNEARTTSSRWKGAKRTDFSCGSGSGPAVGPSGRSADTAPTCIPVSATGLHRGGSLSLVIGVLSLLLLPAFPWRTLCSHFPCQAQVPRQLTARITELS